VNSPTGLVVISGGHPEPWGSLYGRRWGSLYRAFDALAITSPDAPWEEGWSQIAFADREEASAAARAARHFDHRLMEIGLKLQLRLRGSVLWVRKVCAKGAA